jgi:hypothetical protein
MLQFLGCFFGCLCVFALSPLPIMIIMIVSLPAVPDRAAQTEITAKAEDNRSMVGCLITFQSPKAESC